MFYIGIDPGVNGFITILNNDGNLLESLPIPIDKNNEGLILSNDYIVSDIINIFCKYKNGTLFLEKQHPRPGNGAVTVGRQMFGFGLLYGLGHSIIDSVHIVTPQNWQNTLSKKYLKAGQSEWFKSSGIQNGKLSLALSDIYDDKYKRFFEKKVNAKKIDKSKIKSSYLYYKIATNINDIKYTNNNAVDSYLISKFGYEHCQHNNNIFT